MVQVKVEHVIVVLLGLFLLYHFMGSCGCNRVEGWMEMGYNDDQPYVSDNAYCGLSSDFDNYITDSMAGFKKQYDDASADLADKITKYGNAKDKYLQEVARYGAAVDSYNTSDDTDDQLEFLQMANRHAQLANNEVELMDSYSGTINADLNLMTDAQNMMRDKRAKRTKAHVECSKPNRILLKYKPGVACAGTPSDRSNKTIDSGSFNSLTNFDKGKFASNVAQRQWTNKAGATGLNACDIIQETGPINDNYSFMGMMDGTVNKPSPIFGTETYWRTQIDGDIPDNIDIKHSEYPDSTMSGGREAIPRFEGTVDYTKERSRQAPSPTPNINKTGLA
tara:strand:+ start:153 stop:1160 length:1008 start_codon:yes stop_codon:yes gene_type:complete